MRIVVVGAGLVGRRTVDLLVTEGQDDVVLASPRNSLGSVAGEHTIVVLATPSAQQFAFAKEVVQAGSHVVSTADDPTVITRLWSLDQLARQHGATLVVGAAASPGVSTLLAAHLARGLDDVSTISTAHFGTGGPACARQHHSAMNNSASEVHRGRLRRTRSGSGRELVWFPDPVGAADCYRAGLADPFLLHQALPDVERIESRQAATRRDRLTARLPMLRPPHPEGLVGAVWAEVRGRRQNRVEHRAMAATAPLATMAAAMASAFCLALSEANGLPQGAQSAATVENPLLLLQQVSKSMRLWAYDGSQIRSESTMPGPVHAARKWRIPN